MVERPAVNRQVAGSSPAGGVHLREQPSSKRHFLVDSPRNGHAAAGGMLMTVQETRICCYWTVHRATTSRHNALTVIAAGATRSIIIIASFSLFPLRGQDARGIVKNKGRGGLVAGQIENQSHIFVVQQGLKLALAQINHRGITVAWTL